MEGVMRRPFPDLPWISAFPELNLRLYVEYEGKPGVWFLSLDAGNPLAVWAARRFFHLPYFRAKMRLGYEGEEVLYDSVRSGSGEQFKGKYGPAGEVYESKPETLEHWLTERYCLYSQAPGGTIYRGEIHHQPWPLQPAEASIEVNELARPFGFENEGEPALLHFSKRIEVAMWGLERVEVG